MLGEFTTSDGYTLRAFSTLYLDYGIEILKDGETLFYGPCHLSADSYGRKPDPARFDDWDDAETAEVDGDGAAFLPWSEADWIEALTSEADDLIEAFCPYNEE